MIACLAASAFGQPYALRSIELQDLNGAKVRPFDLPKTGAWAFIFIAHDCPISNVYVPEMNRICSEYSKRGAAVFVVYTETDLSLENARRHAKEYGILCRGLMDSSRRLVKLAGATVTPEAAVFDASGRLAYRGRIDDLYLDFGKPRFKATHHDLRSALDAVLNRKPVRVARAKAIGCFIPENH